LESLEVPVRRVKYREIYSRTAEDGEMYSVVKGATLIWLLLCTVSLAENPGYFEYGVASGDPTPDSIILWTRVTPVPNFRNDTMAVEWLVSENPENFSQPVQSGTTTTTADRDWVVKVEARELAPMTRYFYRFKAGDVESPVGTFSLFPNTTSEMSPEEVKLALYSCSNFGWGYFNSYGVGALLGVDAWIHVGDFIYEYYDTYPTVAEAIRRGTEPRKEIITLNDYRTRHAKYREDEGLRLISKSAPLLAMWDDHESANNAWKLGAQNHCDDEENFDPTCPKEGSWEDRKINALRAYHEWLPTRIFPWETEAQNLARYYRYVDFGSLARVYMLETRLLARTETDADEARAGFQSASSAAWELISENPDDPASGIPPEQWPSRGIDESLQELKTQADEFRTRNNKTMLGSEQTRWLNDSLKSSNALWNVISQQLVMQDMYPPDFEAAIAYAENEIGNDTASLWSKTLTNLTRGTIGETYYFLYDDSPNLPGNPRQNMSDALARVLDAQTKKEALTNLALARNKINTNFDSWTGYLRAREELLDLLQSASNPVVYAGDSHEAWAGELYRNVLNEQGEFQDVDQWVKVASEFDGNSVSSPGPENGLVYPYEMLGNATVRNNQPMMKYKEVGNKGLTLMTLTRDFHRAEWIDVPTAEPQDFMNLRASAVECSKAFEAYPGSPNITAVPCSTDLSNLSSQVPLPQAPSSFFVL